MRYFSEHFFQLISGLFGLFLFYSGVKGLITGQIYIGGRGNSSGSIFMYPESMYISILFIVFGLFTTRVLVKSILDYKNRTK